MSDRELPSAVSLTTRPCYLPTNYVPVQSHVTNDSYKWNFAVCVNPFHARYNDTKNIVQWMELNRILGAQHFVFYNFSTTVYVLRVLEFYRKKGLVSVVQWDASRFRKEADMHIYGQHAAMNDCLMRVKNATKFVVNCDLDEYLIPHSNFSTWHQIVEKHPNFGEYQFMNTFFLSNRTSILFPEKQYALKQNLYTTFRLQRQTRIFTPTVRSKYFCRSNVTESMGNHLVFSMTGGWRTYNLPPNEGLLHHYRYMIHNVYPTVEVIKDLTVFEKYKDQLIENVRGIYAAMKRELDQQNNAPR